MENDKKNQEENLKKILSRTPFIPKQPIKRKEFFVGILIIVIIGLIIDTVLSIIFGGLNFLLQLFLIIIFSYIMATWDTKRLLDINPKVNAKIFQIIFFVLIFLVNILTHIKDIMMDEFIAFHDYVELNGLDGAPEFSFSIEMYAVPLSTALRIVGIPLSLFFIFLLLKKGEIKTEVKE